MDRIEAALARLERVLARSGTEARDLSLRHERLKASVGEALSELDALIEAASE